MKPCGLKLYLWFEQNGERAVTDAVCSEGTASEFCSVPWVSDTLCSILMRSQPKGVKLKMRRRELRNGVNWEGALKQTGVNYGLLVCIMYICTWVTCMYVSVCVYIYEYIYTYTYTSIQGLYNIDTLYNLQGTNQRRFIHKLIVHSVCTETAAYCNFLCSHYETEEQHK
jgi:hypothetical protein